MVSEIRELQQKKEDLQKKLGDAELLKDPLKLKKLSMEFFRVEKQLEEQAKREELAHKIKEAEEILKNSTDEDLRALASEEKNKLEKEEELIREKLTRKKSENLPQNVIMEIRAGAGGNEAALFARELFEMYQLFAKKKGWRIAILDESKNDLGGYKEIIFEVDGDEVYQNLRQESGVHRVQRIPATEKTGRVHTSTASVAVLPQAREVDVEIRPQDVKVEFFRSSGPGGQNVNKVETAVRIYHLPSGLTVASQESRSQQKNREQAMTILRAKLLDAKMQNEAQKIASERRKQIGTGDRSEKIRTYNFPQDRVTDHRVKESWHNIEKIMEGNLELIIEAVRKIF